MRPLIDWNISIISLTNNIPKQIGMAYSVKKEGKSKIVELVLPTTKESWAISHP